jgi:hypothetical protein
VVLEACAVADWTIGVWLLAGVLCVELRVQSNSYEPAAKAVERNSGQELQHWGEQ